MSEGGRQAGRAKKTLEEGGEREGGREGMREGGGWELGREGVGGTRRGLVQDIVQRGNCLV